MTDRGCDRAAGHPAGGPPDTAGGTTPLLESLLPEASAGCAGIVQGAPRRFEAACEHIEKGGRVGAGQRLVESGAEDTIRTAFDMTRERTPRCCRCTPCARAPMRNFL